MSELIIPGFFAAMSIFIIFNGFTKIANANQKSRYIKTVKLNISFLTVLFLGITVYSIYILFLTISAENSIFIILRQLILSIAFIIFSVANILFEQQVRVYEDFIIYKGVIVDRAIFNTIADGNRYFIEVNVKNRLRKIKISKDLYDSLN